MLRQSHVFFVDVRNQTRRCDDSRYLLLCHGDEEQLCGHGELYRNYFCFFNRLDMLLESRVYPTYSSVLITYQVLHGLTTLWLNQHLSYNISPTWSEYKIVAPYHLMDLTSRLQSYRITKKVW